MSEMTPAVPSFAAPGVANMPSAFPSGDTAAMPSAVAPAVAPVAAPAAPAEDLPPIRQSTALDAILARVKGAAPVTVQNVYPIPSRPGFAVRLNCDVDADTLRELGKKYSGGNRAQRRGSAAPTSVTDTNTIGMACELIARYTDCLLLDGEEVLDAESDNGFLTFRSKRLQDIVTIADRFSQGGRRKVTGAAECVRGFFDRDGLILSLQNELLTESDYDTEMQAEDPTQG